MAITELKILKYECEYCLHDWTMINTGKDSRSLDDNGYFCPYCGEKEGEHRFATDKEAGFKETKTAPIIAPKKGKPVKVLEAEDRNTQTRCPDGGWWNPITKKCQGEGNGHNVEEQLDNYGTL
jgi:hypothetical protein|tara:strand:- start:1263 stop:1631 length:369 start_codon:yes stop_codon:yes gene_type:complete